MRYCFMIREESVCLLIFSSGSGFFSAGKHRTGQGGLGRMSGKYRNRSGFSLLPMWIVKRRVFSMILAVLCIAGLLNGQQQNPDFQIDTTPEVDEVNLYIKKNNLFRVSEEESRV